MFQSAYLHIHKNKFIHRTLEDIVDYVSWQSHFMNDLKKKQPIKHLFQLLRTTVHSALLQ